MSSDTSTNVCFFNAGQQELRSTPIIQFTSLHNTENDQSRKKFT